MYINLYVEFPTTGQADAWKFTYSTLPVMSHIVQGVLIFLLGISQLVRSIIRKNRHWIIAGSIGVAGSFLAAFSGGNFITTQVELHSYLMAVGFLTTLLALDWGSSTH